MSSVVPSFLSGPKLDTIVLSSSHTTLYGLPHGSLVPDDASSSLIEPGRLCEVSRGEPPLWVAHP